MTTRHNDDLFRRLSKSLQDDEKPNRADEVMCITQGRTYLFKQVGAGERSGERAVAPPQQGQPKESG